MVKVVYFTYKVSMVVLLSECEHSTGSIRLLEFVVDGDQGLQCLGGQPTMKFLLLRETAIQELNNMHTL